MRTAPPPPPPSVNQTALLDGSGELDHGPVLTLREEDAVTLLAATMKSKMSMVAPGRPMEKKRGEQCLMMVLTMSWKEERQEDGGSVKGFERRRRT